MSETKFRVEQAPQPHECDHPAAKREIATYDNGKGTVEFCNRCAGYV